MQFGFRPGSSATCALLAIQDTVTRYFDDESTTGAFLIEYDYTKAFDKKIHEVILKRLMNCSFPRDFIWWTQSYLFNRRQFVRIRIESSLSTAVSSGVPQGSILGPYLFAIATSSFFCESWTCHLIKYKDNSTLSLALMSDFTTTQRNIERHQIACLVGHLQTDYL